jgi:hypothetical protein
MFNKIFSKKEKDMIFDFKLFLTENGWQKKSDNFYFRGFKTIKFVSNSSIMIALNKDKKVKYDHIVTCKVPRSYEEADILTTLTYLK